MKFCVGDIITGVDNSLYPITDRNGTYEVIDVCEYGNIWVRIIRHIIPSHIGRVYRVNSKYFVYAKDFVHWEGIFNMAYKQKTFCVKDGVPVVDGVSVDSPCYKQLCEEYAKYKESVEKEK